jgi:hypothetical protein
VKVKDFLQVESGFFRRGRFQVHPEKKVGVRQQRGDQKSLDIPSVQAALRRKCKRTDHLGAGATIPRRNRLTFGGL